MHQIGGKLKKKAKLLLKQELYNLEESRASFFRIFYLLFTTIETKEPNIYYFLHKNWCQKFQNMYRMTLTNVFQEVDF